MQLRLYQTMRVFARSECCRHQQRKMEKSVSIFHIISGSMNETPKMPCCRMPYQLWLWYPRQAFHSTGMNCNAASKSCITRERCCNSTDHLRPTGSRYVSIPTTTQLGHPLRGATCCLSLLQSTPHRAFSQVIYLVFPISQITG
jgi:hypothetical protein